jgi:glycosyltransferase involved in cell wall biosynthesis/hydroxymethylpyrimidine pyrophosphatase-like HAD family hydrolase
MDKIGILFFIDVLCGPAGAERNLIQVVSGLNKLKYNPIVCALKAGDFIDELNEKGMKVLNLDINRIYGVQAILKLFYLQKLIRKEKIKIIVTYHNSSDYYGLLVGKLFGVPIIISNRRDMGFNLKKTDVFVYRIINKFYSRIITVCDAVKDLIIKSQNVDPSKIRTVYNCVENNLNFIFDNFVNKSEHPLDFNKPTITMIANLRPIKGHKFLLEAASIVKNIFPDVQFLIVGSDISPNETTLSYLKNCVEKLGVFNNVKFLGYRKDTIDILRNSNILVLSSLSEGCSNAILEAMYCAKPVVATVVGGNPELIEDGINGYLVEAKNSQCMAEAILRLLKDDKLAKKFGENGYKKFLENFTKEKMINNLESLFESLLKENTKRNDKEEYCVIESENNLINQDKFAEDFKWCLCPLLSFSEIFIVLKKEIDKIFSEKDVLTSDDILNVYLLLSAMHQIVSDFMIRGFYDFSKLLDGFSFLESSIKFIHRINQNFIWFRNIAFEYKFQKYLINLEKLQSELARCLVQVYKNNFSSLKSSFLESIKELTKIDFPYSLLSRRLKLPSAFRSFALTHIDFFRLCDKFILAHAEELTSIKVIGLRTTGSYLSPILAEYLRSFKGYQVNFVTIRAKSALSFWELRKLKKIVKSDDKILLTDDPPTTGSTLKSCINKLTAMGINNKRIVLLIPEYPYLNEWSSSSLEEPFLSIELHRLSYEEWYINELLKPANIKETLLPYFNNNGFCTTEVNLFTPYTSEINKIFSHKHRMGEREKRVYEIILKNETHPKTMYILAKSVGWGWFGYHALIAANRLKNFVPEIITLKNGFLFMEWIKNKKDPKDEKENFPSIDNLAEYISERVSNLRLQDDPSSKLMDRNICWAEVASVISGVYSQKLGKLKRFKIFKKLVKSLVCETPTMTDGKMGPEKWLKNDKHYLKVDFEEHAFDNSDLSIVDPTYDLASIIYEYKLEGKDEVALLKRYTELSGDNNNSERLFFNKILYAYKKLYESALRINSLGASSERFKCDKSYWQAFMFLTNTTNRYLANSLNVSKLPKITDKLLVLDIDGVFDDYAFIFPSTTPLGVKALKLLQENGFSIIFNSGRTLEEIKEYCRCFGAIGGVAEYGAAIWDNLEGRSKVILPEQEINDFQKLKDIFIKYNNVFVSHLHNYSLRAYIYKKLDHVKLNKELLGEIMECNKIDYLCQAQNVGRTELISMNINKGIGLKTLIEFMNMRPKIIVSIGDSDTDIPMFEYSDMSFAPQNHSRAIKELAKNGKVRIVRGISQRGLLNVAKLLINSQKEYNQSVKEDTEVYNDIGMKILSIKDKPKWLRMLSFIDFDTFRVFRC